ncbi:MAG TPA: hypothetical protein VFB13_14315 [Reyranella sp.]|jgi:hypothetical protein|nr:hypothetical protein [Reyranella sp.]
MCDYSLEVYRSQPAEAGERYQLERFASGSMGFTVGGQCNTAVCIPAEARMILGGISEIVQRAFGVGAIEEVSMTRLERGPHKDAVAFSNGKVVSLQSLNAGLTAVVTSLQPGREETSRDTAAPVIPDLIDAD